MVNPWLIIVACVMAVFVLALVFYLVFLYQSEDDKNQAWLPKVVVIAGLSLACFNVLLLPYDIANRQNPELAESMGGGINTVLCWQIVLISIAAMTFVIVPFCIFYYEAMDSDQKSICTQLRPAICYTTITLFFFLLVLLILWFTLGKAEIPYALYNSAVLMEGRSVDAVVYFYDAYTERKLTVDVSLFVYMTGLMSAVGWVLFFLFGGVGLAALPIDLIRDWRDRPTPISAEEFVKRKTEIGHETQTLIAEGKKLDEAERNGSTDRKHKKRMTLFKQKVTSLEEAYEKLEVSYDPQKGSILIAWVGLFVGILGIFLSLLWLIQIVVHNILDAHPFLSAMFMALDSGFTLFGVMAYGIFAFYLLWCVVKGCTKFGLNLLLFTVHPMKLHGTLMNSFLFNTNLILIASVSCVQFCAMSFRDYAANTAVDALYMNYVSRLKGLGEINKYLQYPLGAVAILSLFWLLICPRCKNDDDDD